MVEKRMMMMGKIIITHNNNNNNNNNNTTTSGGVERIRERVARGDGLGRGDTPDRFGEGSDAAVRGVRVLSVRIE